MGIVGGGGQAELAVVDERQLMPVPDVLDWAHAGGAPEVFTTAHDALFTQCALRRGERLLVNAGAGGVGTAAIQLAIAAGARVHTTVRNAALHEGVAALGAEVIDAENIELHGPFDVILELVGGPNIPTDIEALAPCGRIAVIGVGAGATAEIDLRRLMNTRGSIHASMLRFRSTEQKGLTARALEADVLPLLASGEVVVPIAATFPLEQVATAYERFAAGGKLGKIVLVMN
jgi:NADPH:quinone reductase-like Zn-dependent oxidoreductase